MVLVDEVGRSEYEPIKICHARTWQLMGGQQVRKGREFSKLSALTCQLYVAPRSF